MCCKLQIYNQLVLSLSDDGVLSSSSSADCNAALTGGYAGVGSMDRWTTRNSCAAVVLAKSKKKKSTGSSHILSVKGFQMKVLVKQLLNIWGGGVPT